MRAGSLVLLGSGPGVVVPVRRAGVVRAVGTQYVDDTGAWYPYGGTLMWWLRGVKYDRARVKDNQRFLALQGCDFQRALGHVDWLGNEIDWTWSITEEILGYGLDYSFGEFGLRTSMSLLGARLPDADAIELCRRFAAIVAKRPHTILDVDCGNEATVNQMPMITLQHMAQTLRDAGLPHILSLTDAEHAGLNWLEVRRGDLQVRGANSMTSHPDRAAGDDGCRVMRQPYDCRDLTWTIHMEEPIGPRSSVAECTDPLQLAMLRANGIAHGEGAFILHNGAGVAGQVDPAHNRPANLWEVENIDAMMQAVRNVTRIMRPNAGEGRHWNNQLNNPFRATSIWPDDGHGANRRYTVEYADGFCAITFGVVSPAAYRCDRACRLEVFDPVIGAVIQDVLMPAGGEITLRPRTLDAFGHGAFIVKGTFTDTPDQRKPDPEPEPFGNP